VRERDRSRGLAGAESELELALMLGIAGPKKSVAELVNLLIGALGTGISACGGVGTVAVEKARVFGCLWVG
jgi:hypothetical protein